MKITQLLYFTALAFGPISALSQASLITERRAAESASPATTLPRSEVTGLIAEEQKIVSPLGVQQIVPLQINGITQWLSIRGNDIHNPILLFLHGGPGAPELPTSWLFQRSWEDFFTVVQWDQRGAGKTLVANDRSVLAASMNVKQMTSDGIEVVRYLRKTYGKRKIFLLGHSWGTVLGVAIVQEHPDWFYAYIGVGQVVNVRQNESLGYNFAVEQARRTHNQVAETELAEIAPYPGPPDEMRIEKLATDRKWVTYFGGMEFGRTSVGYINDMAILSPDYSEQDFAAIAAGEGFSIMTLAPELLMLDYSSLINFKCPVFLFEGRHDWTAPYQLATSWYERLQAPAKQIVWFEKSGHMPMLEEPGHFLLHLVIDVRPLAEEAKISQP